MRYEISEFGGNAQYADADNPTDAVKSVFPDRDVFVQPNGYVMLDGEPFGYIKAV